MDEASISKRRRGLGVVTPNACTECRKKRAKCDGNNPCGRCVAQKVVECVYEIPIRQSKENMRAEIERLRAAQNKNENVLAALVSSNTSEQVLEQLRNGDTINAISAKLEGSSRNNSGSASNITTFSRFSDHQIFRNAIRPAMSAGSSLSNVVFNDPQGSDSQPPNQYEANSWSSWGGGNGAAQAPSPKLEQLEDMMKWEPETSPFTTQRPSYPLIGTLDLNLQDPTADSGIRDSRSLGQEAILGQTYNLNQDQLNASHDASWTNITSDRAFIEHLVTLYFCWEYPTFASLSKEHFLEDFRGGNSRHCSSLLVNAILALGCRFSNQANARTDPDDINTSGDHFFAEATTLLEAEKDRHSLTSIQAIGLMSIREASCGRPNEAIFLSGQSIRLAIEMGLHHDTNKANGKASDSECEVRSATFWGAFSLDQAWSLSIGRLPQFSRDIKLIGKPAVIEHIDAAEWVPYTDDGVPFDKPCSQPSNVRSVYETFCQLSEIVHKSLYRLYIPGVQVTSNSLLASYAEFLQWYDLITPVLKLGDNFTPAVLFVHMYYHSAILLLFRPFIKLELINSSVSPSEVCTQAAEAISALSKSYSQLYSLKRTPSFAPYIVLASSITHLVTLSDGRSGPEQVRQCLIDLKDMAGSHGFVIQCVNILCYLIRRWDVNFPLEEGDQELQDVKSISRPHLSSTNVFSPNVSAPDLDTGIGAADKDGNLLFLPFPFQGRPFLNVGESLQEAGFKISDAIER